jgi:FkbM family methyltransferase
MKLIRGVYLPDGDEHFAPHLNAGPVVNGRGTYQIAKYRAALPHVVGRAHAVDIGAHVGLWSLAMARDFARVTAFEPLLAHIACHAENCRGIDNITLLPIALSDRDETLSIFMPPDNTGHAHVAKGGLLAQAVPLDSLDIGPMDLVKIDVEGYEHRVLLGGEDTIRRHRPAVIVEQKPDNAERYGMTQKAAVALLASWGMRQVWEMAGDHLMVWP